MYPVQICWHVTNDHFSEKLYNGWTKVHNGQFIAIFFISRQYFDIAGTIISKVFHVSCSNLLYMLQITYSRTSSIIARKSNYLVNMVKCEKSKCKLSKATETYHTLTLQASLLYLWLVLFEMSDMRHTCVSTIQTVKGTPHSSQKKELLDPILTRRSVFVPYPYSEDPCVHWAHTCQQTSL